MKYDYWLIDRGTLKNGNHLEEVLNDLGHLGWRLNHFGSDYLVFEKETSGDSPEIEPLSKSSTIDTLSVAEEEAGEERIYA